MPTIDTLAYKMVLDYSQFTQGMVATRKELALGKQLTAEFASETEKFAMQMGVLDSLYEKNAIDVKTYDRAVDDLIRRQRELEDATEDAGKQVSDFGDKFQASFLGNLASTAVTRGLDMITDGIRRFGREVIEEFENLEQMSMTAKKLGLSTESFFGLEVVAKRRNVDFDLMADSIRKMQVQLVNAAEGSKEAAKKFGDLNLNVRALLDLSPERQFLLISEAINNMGTSQERLNATVDIFGRAGDDMVHMLGMTQDEWQAAAADARDYHLAVGDAGLSSVIEANDAVDELALTWRGMKRDAAETLSPMARDLLVGVRGLVEGGPGGKAGGWFDQIVSSPLQKQMLEDKFRQAYPELFKAKESVFEEVPIEKDRERVKTIGEFKIIKAEVEKVKKELEMVSRPGGIGEDFGGEWGLGRIDKPSKEVDFFGEWAAEQRAKMLERNVDKIVEARMRDPGQNTAVMKGSAEALRLQHDALSATERSEEKTDRREAEKAKLLAEIAKNTAMRERLETVGI